MRTALVPPRQKRQKTADERFDAGDQTIKAAEIQTVAIGYDKPPTDPNPNQVLLGLNPYMRGYHERREPGLAALPAQTTLSRSGYYLSPLWWGGWFRGKNDPDDKGRN